MGSVKYKGEVHKNVKMVGVHNGALILNINGRSRVLELGVDISKDIFLEFSAPMDDVEYSTEYLCIQRYDDFNKNISFKKCEYVEVFLVGEFDSIVVDDSSDYHVCMDLMGKKRIVNEDNPFIINNYSNRH